MKDGLGSTAMILATKDILDEKTGVREVVQVLLDHGADPDIRNIDGDSALIKATENPYLKIVEQRFTLSYSMFPPMVTRK